MKLGDQRASGNVEDRRGMGVGTAGGLGIGGVIIALVAMFFGVDPSVVLDAANQAAPQRQAAPARPQDPNAPPDAGKVFVSKILGSTEDVWTQQFKASKSQYREPKLVLFSGAVQSACGMGQAAMGPFYCPGDERLYIDLEFLATLQRKLRAEGDFAAAYVIAHEVGHHVQKLTGAMDQRRGAGGGGNAASVKIELQADCYAGVWGFHAGQKNMLEQGDIEEAINAAGAVGDDRIQGRSGMVRPESFTHGSSAQRAQAFKRGLQRGDPADCDTGSNF